MGAKCQIWHLANWPGTWQKIPPNANSLYSLFYGVGGCRHLATLGCQTGIFSWHLAKTETETLLYVWEFDMNRPLKRDYSSGPPHMVENPSSVDLTTNFLARKSSVLWCVFYLAHFPTHNTVSCKFGGEFSYTRKEDKISQIYPGNSCKS